MLNFDVYNMLRRSRAPWRIQLLRWEQMPMANLYCSLPLKYSSYYISKISLYKVLMELLEIFFLESLKNDNRKMSAIDYFAISTYGMFFQPNHTRKYFQKNVWGFN